MMHKLLKSNVYHGHHGVLANKFSKKVTGVMVAMADIMATMVSSFFRDEFFHFFFV